MSIARAAIALIIMLAYISAVLVLTLSPTVGQRVEPNLVPLAGIADSFAGGNLTYGLTQTIGNLLLLLPVGVLLPGAFRGLRGWQVAAVALILAAAIESAQWWLGMGRMADVDDLWLNTLGALIGYAFTRTLFLKAA